MPRRRNHRRKKQHIAWGWLAWLALLLALLFIYFKYGNATQPNQPGKNVTLVQPNEPSVVAGTARWEYHQSLPADFDNDGNDESVEIIARVLRTKQSGQYQWDDGQPWQVYVKDGDKITHIYKRYVQLGQLQVLVTDEVPPRIGIAESQGAGYALYAVTYNGPSNSKTQQLASLPVHSKTW